MRLPLLTLLLGCIVGFWGSRQFAPKIVIKKDTEQSWEKEKIKTVIVEKPGGTRTITKTEYRDKVVEKKKEIPVPISIPRWEVGVKRWNDEAWSTEVRYRFWGSLRVGLEGRSDGHIGVGLSMPF